MVRRISGRKGEPVGNAILNEVHWSQLTNTERGVLAAAVISVCATRLGVSVPHVYEHKDNPKVRKARGLSIAVLHRLGADWSLLEKVFKSAPRYLKVAAASAVADVADQSFHALVLSGAERFLQTNPKG